MTKEAMQKLREECRRAREAAKCRSYEEAKAQALRAMRGETREPNPSPNVGQAIVETKNENVP